MACALRQGMFQKKVLLLEKHTLMGGLNSYYYRKVGDKRIRIDTGLHALTNFTPKGEKSSKVLPQILKQFRISHDELKLKEQSFSKVIIDGTEVLFSNDLSLLTDQISKKFPAELDNFLKFIPFVQDADLRLYKDQNLSGLELLRKYFKDPLFIRMISFPIFCYGSSWEDDLDAYLFVTMFRSIYLEGFARPQGGIKTLIDLMLERISQCPTVEIQKSAAVRDLCFENDLWKISTQTSYYAPLVFSSLGYPETKLLAGENIKEEWVSPISFVEVIFMFQDRHKGDHPETIIFFNEDSKSIFRGARDFVDYPMGVICQLENYQDSAEEDTVIKITFCGNFKKWNESDSASYETEKQKVIETAQKILNKYLPLDQRVPLYIDCFTPRTIKKYTSHLAGSVYGSQIKFKHGRCDLKNMILIGADQGNLGITGSILSGTDMANQFSLK